MAGKRKQRLCRICKKRPPWNYKNCPPGVCKQCYHKRVWVGRPAARKERTALAGQHEVDELSLEVDEFAFDTGLEDAPDELWADEPFLLVGHLPDAAM